MKTLAVSLLRRLRGVPAATGVLLGRLWAWLRADAAAKAVSLLAAASVFYLVHTEGQEERSLWIRVDAKNFEGTQTISELDPADVRVTVRGPSERVLGIDPDAMRLRVGRAPRPGESRLGVRLRRSMLRRVDGSRALPESVRVVSFEPRSVSLTFDEEIQCEFPIDLPRITGRPAIPGTASASFADVSNRTVAVKGPSRVLQPLVDTGYRLRTDPVNINDRSQSFETTVRVNPAEEIRSLLRESDYEVRVRVSINEDTATRDFEGVPVLLAAPSDGRRLFSGTPTNVDVRVSGQKTLVERVRPENITAIAFCGEAAGAAGVARPVEVSLAAEFRQLRAVSLTPEVTVLAEDVVREEPPVPEPDVVVLAPEEGAPEPDGAAPAAPPSPAAP